MIDYASGWEYDLYKVRSKPAGGGTLDFRWGGRTRLDGDGLGTNATAAHFALSAGIIRPEEMAAGRIDHALFMVVKCTAGTVYPAGGGGAQCADPTNAPAGGMRFQLGYSSAEIEALSVPRWKKTILHALGTYGAYIGDTGGAGMNFQFQSGSTYTSFGRTDRLVDWASKEPGVMSYNGKYVLDLAPGVDWSRLRVIDPCARKRHLLDDRRRPGRLPIMHRVGSGDRPLRVLTLIDSLTAGGAELLVSKFAAAAPAVGVTPIVAYLGERDGSPAAGRLREQGVEPVCVRSNGLFNPPSLARVRAHVR